MLRRALVGHAAFDRIRDLRTHHRKFFECRHSSAQYPECRRAERLHVVRDRAEMVRIDPCIFMDRTARQVQDMRQRDIGAVSAR